MISFYGYMKHGIQHMKPDCYMVYNTASFHRRTDLMNGQGFPNGTTSSFDLS